MELITRVLAAVHLVIPGTTMNRLSGSDLTIIKGTDVPGNPNARAPRTRRHIVSICPSPLSACLPER
ncbi:hypothetical protein EYF80_017544 [Liparis tanakae]|uniref:Uncharacterized protein n=1 Tax=Liparis tanakae TaxID=230148 RepID=A0A4Z2I364_9TELE|nr:hypothetical protein EYF80_017544 [Liparis tanakae]